MILKFALFCLTPLFFDNSNVEGKSLQKKAISIEDTPWTVFVESDGRNVLLGSIVGPNLVVSATRPIDHLDPKDFLVRAGSSKVGSGGSTHNIIKVVTHPWARYNGGHDVGVFTVDPPFQLDETRQIIKLNRNALLYPDASVSFIHNGELDIIPLTPYPQPDCKIIYGIIGGVDNSTACAMSEAEVGPCFYDLGTGIVQDGKLIGSLAVFPFCSNLDYWPLLYTNFSEIMVSMWLEANIPEV